MIRIRVGDLVRRIRPGDGTQVGQRFLPRVYRVTELIDHRPVDGPREKNAVIKMETLDGDSAGWEYVWNVDVVVTIQQQELEKLRVSLGRIAQKLGLNHRVPGNRSPDDFSFQSLCLQAKLERGWHALAACCIDRIDELKKDAE